ncbi:MAG: RNA polymerase sigma factor [Actinomycetota bacterium]
MAEEPVERPAEEVAQNREAAVGALFDAYYSSLRGLAVVILGHPEVAEEAVMEAFVKLYARWGRLESLDYPPAYLRRMVVNQCLSRLRRKRIEARVNELFHRQDEMSRSSEVFGDADALEVWAAVRTLPPRQRLCVALRYVEDLPDREIARLLDCSVGTVKSQLSKARNKLARLLGKQGAGGFER